MSTKSTFDQGSQRDQDGEPKAFSDETKEVYGCPRAVDAGRGQGSLKERVDRALNQSSEDAETVPSDPRAEELMEEGFTVGRRADHHDLAARRQP